jgi:hypothetical protein
MTMKRLDREGMYTIPIWVGLLLTGFYVLWRPGIHSSLDLWLEATFAIITIFSSSLCLIGAAIPQRILAYKMQIVGLAINFLVLGALAGHIDRPLIEQWTLAGGMGGLIQIGNVRMIVQLWSAIRDDKRLRLAEAQVALFGTQG